MRPTIVLVEGASRDRVIGMLMSPDHRVVAPSHLGHRVIVDSFAACAGTIDLILQAAEMRVAV